MSGELMLLDTKDTDVLDRNIQTLGILYAHNTLL